MSFSQFYPHPIVLYPIEYELTDFQYGAHPSGITATISYQIWLDLIFVFLDIYFLKKKKSAFSSYLYTSVSLKTPSSQNTKRNHNNIKNLYQFTIHIFSISNSLIDTSLLFLEWVL